MSMNAMHPIHPKREKEILQTALQYAQRAAEALPAPGEINEQT
jgi:hypothetical protein